MSVEPPGSGLGEDKISKMGTVSGWLAGSVTLIMMVAIVREVVGRYFFRAPSDWSLELSEYLLVALAYLGAPYTELTEGNIRIDFLYERFSPRVRAGVDIFIHCAALAWVLMLMWQGWRLAWESWELGARSSEAMAWPLFPSQVLVPIGCLLLSLVILRKIGQRIKFLAASGKH
jgi:TRAP-type C4-dicarboxylate transport system permease small subunit